MNGILACSTELSTTGLPLESSFFVKFRFIRTHVTVRHLTFASRFTVDDVVKLSTCRLRLVDGGLKFGLKGHGSLPAMRSGKCSVHVAVQPVDGLKEGGEIGIECDG